MKLLSIIIIYMLMFYNVVAQEKDTASDYFAVKTDILTTTLGIFSPNFTIASLSLEKKIFNRQTMSLTGIYSLLEAKYSEQNYSKTEKSFQIIPEYRYYLKRNDFRKIYCGGYLKYNSMTSNINGVQDSTNENYNIEIGRATISEGIIVGYQLFLKKRFILDFLLGGGLRQKVSEKIISGAEYWGGDDSKDNFDLRLAINVGYRIL